MAVERNVARDMYGKLSKMLPMALTLGKSQVTLTQPGFRDSMAKRSIPTGRPEIAVCKFSLPLDPHSDYARFLGGSSWPILGSNMSNEYVRTISIKSKNYTPMQETTPTQKLQDPSR